MIKTKIISLMDLPGQYKLIERDVSPAIKKVLESGKYILGPEVLEFEENFANYCNAKYCVGISSGTEALILALKALDIGPGDEVITVPNTFFATVEAIEAVGASIVFCDVERKTMNMDPESLQKKITKKTKAVIPVHLHGNPADIDAVHRVVKPYKIAVIEDSAQAHGATYKGKIIGSHKSDFVCFSFHPVKNLGAFGDAGAIVTNNKDLAEKLKLLSNHGRHGHYEHYLIGTTGRLDTLQAAVLDVKLTKLNSWINKRNSLVDYYKKRLDGYCEFIETTKYSTNSFHVFAILIDKRDELSEHLEKNGIETGMHYPIPLHLQKALKKLGYKKGDFPNAEYYAKRTLSLPLYPHMTKNEVDYVVDNIKEFYS